MLVINIWGWGAAILTEVLYVVLYTNIRILTNNKL